MISYRTLMDILARVNSNLNAKVLNPQLIHGVCSNIAGKAQVVSREIKLVIDLHTER